MCGFAYGCNNTEFGGLLPLALPNSQIDRDVPEIP